MNMIVAFIRTAIPLGVPLLYGSVGEIVTEKSGHLNLGIPGIMYVGGISGVIGAFLYEQACGNVAENMVPALAILIPLLSAIAGSVLPASVQTALGIMLYGMFIAIVVPQAKQEKSMGICMILALIFSCLFTWLPGLNAVSAGIAIVICTVAAAAICAWVFPIPNEEVAA